MTEPLRRELQVHCYRMMGSVQDAEDMVQETFLRAWRRRETYEGRASFRAWLYKIATNACLDALDKRPRRACPTDTAGRIDAGRTDSRGCQRTVWLEPYPDEWLVGGQCKSGRRVATREHITLAFIAALHLLPPRQRAVIDFARCAGLAGHRNRGSTGDDRLFGEKCVASRAGNARQARIQANGSRSWIIRAGTASALCPRLGNSRYSRSAGAAEEDATFSMPPIPSWYQGRATIGGLVGKTIFAGEAKGRWKLIPTRANGQIAFGLYRLNPSAGGYTPYAIQVLTFTDGQIADITTFRSPGLAAKFELPELIPT